MSKQESVKQSFLLIANHMQRRAAFVIAQAEDESSPSARTQYLMKSADYINSARSFTKKAANL